MRYKIEKHQLGCFITCHVEVNHAELLSQKVSPVLQDLLRSGDIVM